MVDPRHNFYDLILIHYHLDFSNIEASQKKQAEERSLDRSQEEWEACGQAELEKTAKSWWETMETKHEHQQFASHCRGGSVKARESSAGEREMKLRGTKPRKGILNEIVYRSCYWQFKGKNTKFKEFKKDISNNTSTSLGKLHQDSIYVTVQQLEQHGIAHKRVEHFESSVKMPHPQKQRNNNKNSSSKTLKK